MTISIRIPAGNTIAVIEGGATGANITPDANGFAAVSPLDITTLLRGGFRLPFLPIQSQAINDTNGMIKRSLPLTHFKNITGASLAAAAAANVFGYTSSLGTGLGLVTESANNGTKTDAAMIEYVLPPEYVAGTNLTATVSTTITIGGGTLSVKTAQVKAYRVADAGTQGTDIGPGSATAIAANTATDTAFTITGTTLSPGDRVLFEVIVVLTETASSGVTATVNSFRLS